MQLINENKYLKNQILVLQNKIKKLEEILIKQDIIKCNNSFKQNEILIGKNFKKNYYMLSLPF